MKIKYNNFIYSLLLLFLLSACMEDFSTQKSSRLITFQASVPSNETRAGVYLQSGTLDLISQWREGETISIFIFQDGNSYELPPAPISGISTDGKQCSFSIELPEAVAFNKPYDIYGLCGAKGEISVSAGTVSAKSTIWREPFNDHVVTAPMWFHAISGADNVVANFKHLGTYEVLHVENNTDASITFSHRGFDVQNAWYKIEDNTLLSDYYDPSQHPSATGDAESGSITIGAHESGSIYSWYIPSGSPVSGARLKAMIDGRNVVSSNTKSSTLQIQRGHAYHQYVSWNGTDLTFCGGMEEAVVYDVTDPDISGIDIISIESDGTLKIETSEDNTPKVGDFLCSSVSDQAPYGFLLKVVEVEKLEATRGLDDLQDYLWIIRTVKTGIDEIFSNIDIDHVVNLQDVSLDKVTDNEGNSIALTEQQREAWKIPIPKLSTSFLSLYPEICIIPEKLIYHLHIQEHEIKNLGIEFDAKIETKIQLDADLIKGESYEKKFDVYNVFLTPIPIPYTPVVITPLFQVFLSVSGEANAKISFVPINELYQIKLGAQYNGDSKKIEPITGDKFINATEITLDKEVTDMGGSFNFDGSVKASFGGSLSFGVEGSNYIERVEVFAGEHSVFADLLSADFLLDLNREFETNMYLSFNDIDSYFDGSDFRFNDACSWKNYLEAHANFSVRVYNPFTERFVGFTPEPSFFKFEFWNEKYFPTLFVADFSNFQILPNQDYIELSANKFKPFFAYSIFKEKGLGFRYVKCDNSGYPIGEWTDVDLSSYYSEGYPDLFSFLMNAYVPMSSFTRDTCYYVVPYVYGNFAGQSKCYYIHRKGKYIKVTNNGTITDNELPDVPGIDLN